MKTANKLASMRILLVECNELVRNSLSLAFKQSACNLQCADSANKGLETLRDESFDIIISDFSLPDMDGYEFFKKANEIQSKSLKVLITSYIEEDVNSRPKKLDAGVNKVIEKPFTFQKLTESLNDLIG